MDVRPPTIGSHRLTNHPGSLSRVWRVVGHGFTGSTIKASLGLLLVLELAGKPHYKSSEVTELGSPAVLWLSGCWVPFKSLSVRLSLDLPDLSLFSSLYLSLSASLSLSLSLSLTLCFSLCACLAKKKEEVRKKKKKKEQRGIGQGEEKN